MSKPTLNELVTEIEALLTKAKEQAEEEDSSFTIEGADYYEYRPDSWDDSWDSSSC